MKKIQYRSNWNKLKYSKTELTINEFYEISFQGDMIVK